MIKIKNYFVVPLFILIVIITSFLFIKNTAGVAQAITDSTPPTISITSPSAGNVAGVVTLSAIAKDDVGVTKVEFYRSTKLIATVTTFPYTYLWNTVGSAANGTYPIIAKAYDASGKTASATVSIHISNKSTALAQDITAPTISLVSSSTGTVSGSLTLSATASDDTGVTKVDFFYDNTLISSSASSPYTASLDTKTIKNGAHSLSAIAYDAAGNQTPSAAISVTVNNPDITPPTISLTSPIAGTTNGTINFSADASDDLAGGVTKVEFYRGAKIIATVTTPPYTYSWNTVGAVANGPYPFSATAYDAAGHKTSTTPITVTVNNPDVIKPTVSVTGPADASSLKGTTNITATANDNLKVTRVDFFYDNTLIYSDPSAPYNATLDTTKISNGTHPFKAIAYDAAGNASDPSSITVTVNNPDIIPPVISSFTSSPSGGTSGTFTFTVNASDNTGVTKVEFYKDTDTTPFATTTSSFTATFDTTTLTNDIHTFKAIAYDAAGNKATSGLLTVTLNNDKTPPVISAVTTTTITTTGATITWTTDENSDSQVEYGTTSTYGATTSVDSTLVKSHSVVLAGLNSNTEYHYRVISTDASNNKAAPSDDNVFTTVSLAGTCDVSSKDTTPKKYYVDNDTDGITTDGVGDDKNSGLCPTTPWKTLDKVSKTTFNPGDTILFKKGDTFYSSTSTGYTLTSKGIGKIAMGGLPVNQSGTSALPITYGAYGTGVNPVITGLTSIPDGTAGWTNKGNNIWETTNPISPSFPSVINLVLVNGVDTAMGRWPDVKSSDISNLNKDVLPIAGYGTKTVDKNGNVTSYSAPYSVTTTTKALSNIPSPTASWSSGAEIVIYDSKFTILRSPLSSESGTTFTYKTPGATTPDDNAGFFIQNDPATLSQNNEWYYNPTTGHLQMYTTDKNGPSKVEVPTVGALLTMKNDPAGNPLHDVTIDGISFKGSNLASIDLSMPSNITIQNIDVSFSGTSAIYARGNPNKNIAQANTGENQKETIQNSTFNYIHNNGIEFARANPPSSPEYSNIDINHNKFNNIGMIPGMGQSGGHHIEAIIVQGDHATIDHNTITNVGLVAIYFLGRYITVSNNNIDHFNMVIKDSGAIYTWNSNSNTAATLYDGCVDKSGKPIFCQSVINNIISNGGGDPTDRANRDGIYLDNNTNNVEVKGNTVYNVGNGIILNFGNSNVNVTGNTIYSALHGIDINACRNKSITNNIDVENNIIVSDQNHGVFEGNNNDEKKVGQQTIEFSFSRQDPDGCVPAVVPVIASDNTLDIQATIDSFNASFKNILSQGQLPDHRSWKIDNNIYARPLNDATTIQRDKNDQYIDQNVKTNPATVIYGKVESLKDWQDQSGLDSNSKVSPIQIPSTNAPEIQIPSTNGIDSADFILRYNKSDSTIQSSLPSGNYTDMMCNSYSGSVTVAPWSSITLIKGTCPASVVAARKAAKKK